MGGQVLVVGSINVDLVVGAARLPAPGETVAGGAFSEHQGGKGANQAVAAARVGATVSLVGAVGDDDLGVAARAALAVEGIDVARVAVRSAPTGVALIVVDAAGENQIVVAPGANALVGPADVTAEALDAADVVLTGFEIPLEAVLAAVRGARDRGRPVLVNAAPAMALPAELVASGAVLVINERELPLVSGAATDGGAEALTALTAGPVVLTRGAAGAVLLDGATRTSIPGVPAERVVDTTGAGDAFIGVLAAFLAAGRPLEEAARAGVAAGSLAVGQSGAREGMPSAARLAAVLAGSRH